MEVLNISLVPRKKQNKSDQDIEMSSELISVWVYHEEELGSRTWTLISKYIYLCFKAILKVLLNVELEE